MKSLIVSRNLLNAVDRKGWWIILSIGYTVINLILFLQTGVRVMVDSGRYTEYANALRYGFYIDPHNIWYIGYAFFLGVLTNNANDFSSLIIAQYFVAFIGLLALFRTSELIFASRRVAYLASALFLVFYEISLWNAYVLTESLFISSTCIALWCLALAYRNPESLIWKVAAGLMVLFTMFIRPTGMALGIALVVGLILPGFRSIRNLLTRMVLVLVFAFLCALLLNRMLATFNVMEHYQQGELMTDVSELPDAAQKFLVIQPPTELYQSVESDPPLMQMVLFIAHHPGFFLKMSVAKALYLVLHARPYWSWWHNVFVLSILLPCYFFFVKGLRRIEDQRLIGFIVSYISIHLVAVSLTFEDWDGRFLLPLLPIVFPIAAYGLEGIIKARVSGFQN